MFRFGGFRDGHCHPLFAARESIGPSVSHCASINEIVGELTAYLARNPGCSWVDSASYSPATDYSGGAVRQALDLVSQTVPIVVHAEDHHSIWVNSAALAAAGFAESAPVLERGRFELDSDGRPTGVVHEWEAMSLIYQYQPAPDIYDDLKALDAAQNRLLAAGIVAAQDAWIDRGMERAYLEAARTDSLRMRFNLAVRIDPKSWKADLQFARALRSSVREVNNHLLTANTVKVFIDGVFGSQTALTTLAYTDGSRAQALWSQPELHQMALAADSAGFQLHFHAVGDAAVSEALDTVEYVELCNGPVDRRPVIAHADLVSPDDLPRLRKLGVIACVQPAWAVESDGVNQVRNCLGHGVGESLYPIRALLDAGVLVSFGSDWPVSEPEPVHAIVGAQLRQSPVQNTTPLTADQCITRTEALKAHSSSVAYQLGQEYTMAEDWVEFDTDLTRATPAELLAAKVLSVTVAGRLVWPN